MTPVEETIIKRLALIERTLTENGIDLDLLLLEYRHQKRPWTVKLRNWIKEIWIKEILQ